MRATVLLVTALVVVGAGVPLAAGAPTAASGSPASAAPFGVQETTQENDTESNETAPGARLAGVVNVQGAEVTGEMEERSFGLQVAAANSNASKASVVAEQTEELQSRLAELRERKQELRERKQSGNISQSQFRAEMAGLAAEISTLQRLSNRTSETARSLPADVLASKNVDTGALGRLQQDAGELTGPEMAKIARDIAGPPSNRSRGPPGDGNGPPGDGPGVGDTPTTDGPLRTTTERNTTVAPGNGSDGPGDGPTVTTPGGPGVPGTSR